MSLVVISPRQQIVDFVRGLAILDMMLVHYSAWFDEVQLGSLGKVIRFTDFAVEGFVLLAGYIVGSRYFDKFQTDKASVVRTLLRRALGVVSIQYIMIVTLSVPMALIVGRTLTGPDTVVQFAMKSFFFLNQVPLLHILPTFIPLFLLSIPLLYALTRDLDAVVLGLSVCVFALGQWHPYFPLSSVEKSIFPPILWQVYLVLGALVGKHQRVIGAFLRRYGRLNLLAALCLCIMMMLVYHGHHAMVWWGELLQQNQLVVRKFPLNWFGLLYHGSILYLVVSTTAVAWNGLKRHKVVLSSVISLGRNSLALFIIHVYVYFIITYLLDQSFPIALSLIVLNIVGSLWVARALDEKALFGRMPSVVVHS